MESKYDDKERKAYLTSGQIIHSFHKSEWCSGPCPVHNPSEHSMRSLDLHYSFTIGSFFRITSDLDYIVDPDDYNLNKNGEVIVENSVVCKNCKDEIVSKTRHDFVTCSCGSVSVDGGSSYLRRVGSNFKDTSIITLKEKK